MRLAVIACAFGLFAAGGCGDGNDDASDSAQTSPGAAGIGSTDPEESDALAGEEGTADDGGPDDAAGSDSEGEQEQPPPSRAGYIRAADQICADARPDLAAVGRDLQKLLLALQNEKIDKDEYNSRSGDLTEEFAAIAERAVADLEALRPPEAGGDALDSYLTATRTQVRLLAEQADAQREGDVRASGKLNRQLIRAGKQTRAAAERFGFHRCGQG